VALPEVPVKATVKPSGGTDDTATIQDALNTVYKLPLENGFRGAVLLGPGVYPCSSTIFITTNGVVLRGSGSGNGGASGGSIIKMSGGKHTAITLGISGRRQRARPAEEGGRSPDDEPLEPTTPMVKTVPTQITDAYVPSGASSFTVADASH